MKLKVRTENPVFLISNFLAKNIGVVNATLTTPVLRPTVPVF